jgi:hypothetical protein
MNKLKSLILGVIAILFAVITIALVALVTGLIVMLLWNWLMPDIFGLPEITYFQGWGLSLLAGILFKSSASNSD